MSCQHLICLDIQISMTEAPDMSSTRSLSLFRGTSWDLRDNNRAPKIVLPHHEYPKRYLRGDREQNLRKETGNLVLKSS